MFNYSEKTKVDVRFKMLELFKTIKADKLIKQDAENISSVILTNTLSKERTNLESTDQVKEIYVIEIVLNKNKIPSLFIEAFNKQINFQTLFKIVYENKVKYICSIKQIKDDKVKILKTFESEWQDIVKNQFPLVTSLENVYKEMIHKVLGYKFKQDETFEKYIERTSGIRKLKLEIEKFERMRDAEKQPSIKMSINDKIRQLKNNIKETL